jgi:predicted chitinase
MAEEEKQSPFKDALRDSSSYIVRNAFPQLGLFFDKLKESDKKSNDEAEEDSGGKTKRRNSSGGGSSTLAAVMDEGFNEIHGDLEKTNIILSSSYEEQIKTNKLLEKFLVDGGKGVGSGKGGGGLASAIGGAAIGEIALSFGKKLMGGLIELLPALGKFAGPLGLAAGLSQLPDSFTPEQVEKLHDNYKKDKKNKDLTKEIKNIQDGILRLEKEIELEKSKGLDVSPLERKKVEEEKKIQNLEEQKKDNPLISDNPATVVPSPANPSVNPSNPNAPSVPQTTPYTPSNPNAPSGPQRESTRDAVPSPDNNNDQPETPAQKHQKDRLKTEDDKMRERITGQPTVRGTSRYSDPSNTQHNKQYFLDGINKAGITDNAKRAALAAVVEGESNFNPHTETDYSHTQNDDHIRDTLRNLRGMSNEEIDKLKADPKAFFDKAYGGINGNNNQDDGYNYRGRGYIQLTGKGNYERYGKLSGHPEIVKNPELANDPKIAAEIATAYMRDRYDAAPGSTVYEKTARAIGKVNPRTEARKIAAYKRNMQTGEFSNDKVADLSFEKEIPPNPTGSRPTTVNDSSTPNSGNPKSGDESRTVEDLSTIMGKDDLYNKPEIQEYLRTGGVNMDPHQAAWCAAAVNASLAKEGIKGPTDAKGNPSLWVPDFKNWGESVKPEDVKKGDVLEYKDGSHIGLYTGRKKNGQLEMIAGNEYAGKDGAGPGRTQVGKVGTHYMSADELNIRRASQRDLIAPPSIAKVDHEQLETKAKIATMTKPPVEAENVYYFAKEKEKMTLKQHSNLNNTVNNLYSHKNDSQPDKGKLSKIDAGKPGVSDDRIKKLFTGYGGNQN